MKRIISIIFLLFLWSVYAQQYTDFSVIQNNCIVNTRVERCKPVFEPLRSKSQSIYDKILMIFQRQVNSADGAVTLVNRLNWLDNRITYRLNILLNTENFEPSQESKKLFPYQYFLYQLREEKKKILVLENTSNKNSTNLSKNKNSKAWALHGSATDQSSWKISWTAWSSTSQFWKWTNKTSSSTNSSKNSWSSWGSSNTSPAKNMNTLSQWWEDGTNSPEDQQSSFDFPDPVSGLSNAFTRFGTQLTGKITSSADSQNSTARFSTGIALLNPAFSSDLDPSQSQLSKIQNQTQTQLQKTLWNTQTSLKTIKATYVGSAWDLDLSKGSKSFQKTPRRLPKLSITDMSISFPYPTNYRYNNGTISFSIQNTGNADLDTTYEESENMLEVSCKNQFGLTETFPIYTSKVAGTSSKSGSYTISMKTGQIITVSNPFQIGFNILDEGSLIVSSQPTKLECLINPWSVLLTRNATRFKKEYQLPQNYTASNGFPDLVIDSIYQAWPANRNYNYDREEFFLWICINRCGDKWNKREFPGGDFVKIKVCNRGTGPMVNQLVFFQRSYSASVGNSSYSFKQLFGKDFNLESATLNLTPGQCSDIVTHDFTTKLFAEKGHNKENYELSFDVSLFVEPVITTATPKTWGGYTITENKIPLSTSQEQNLLQFKELDDKNNSSGSSLTINAEDYAQ